MKISVIIIAKDAENDIVDAISSVTFADETIVIDNNSQDRTAALAVKLGAKVFPYQSKDFADLRNHGLKKAKGEWVLYIDTDERVTKELQASIQNSIDDKSKKLSAYKIQRKNFYYGNNEWPYKEYLERLFKRAKLKGWYGVLHESPKIEGDIGELDGFLLHYSHKDLSSMVTKTIEWSTIEANLRFEANHPKMTWWRFPRVMVNAFLNSYLKQGGWKAGVPGVIESTYQAFSMFITYAKLWELQRKTNEK